MAAFRFHLLCYVIKYDFKLVNIKMKLTYFLSQGRITSEKICVSRLCSFKSVNYHSFLLKKKLMFLIPLLFLFHLNSISFKAKPVPSQSKVLKAPSVGTSKESLLFMPNFSLTKWLERVDARNIINAHKNEL